MLTETPGGRAGPRRDVREGAPISSHDGQRTLAVTARAERLRPETSESRRWHSNPRRAISMDLQSPTKTNLGPAQNHRGARLTSRRAARFDHSRQRLGALLGASSPEVTEIAVAWDGLPKGIRHAILVLVRSQSSQRQRTGSGPYSRMSDVMLESASRSISVQSPLRYPITIA